MVVSGVLRVSGSRWGIERVVALVGLVRCQARLSGFAYRFRRSLGDRDKSVSVFLRFLTLDRALRGLIFVRPR